MVLLSLKEFKGFWCYSDDLGKGFELFQRKKYFILEQENREILSSLEVNFFRGGWNKSLKIPRIFLFHAAFETFFSVSSDLNVGELRKLLWPT